jgi:hypothetical protein
MSLRRFLNVAFAILVEEYQRMGVDLISALEKVAEWSEGAVAKPVSAASPPAQSPSQNQQSMAMLEGMLAGVPNAPTKRKPRRSR